MTTSPLVDLLTMSTHLRAGMACPAACDKVAPTYTAARGRQAAGAGHSTPLNAPPRTRSTPDVRRIYAGQAVRAFGYGFSAVLLGASLGDRGLSGWQVGLVLGAIVAGSALMSVLVARHADSVGRRRFYAALYAGLGGVGVVFALADQVWALAAVGLTGVLSTEVIESGPFTSLEQVMISTELRGRAQVRGFGTYNAIAAVAGSLGALAAGLTDVLHGAWSGAPDSSHWFLALVPVAVLGGAIALSLSPRVEAGRQPRGRRARLERSRPTVVRLAGLFALDAFGGGFTVSAFVAYWLNARFGASTQAIGILFFFLGLLQTASFLVAPRLAERYGLLNTMVFTHLPSNFFLALVAFAPTFPVAVVLLTARTLLSQMDVPTRQAYVMALVEPDERTPAAAYTNTVRYVARPFGPPLAGLASQVALGLPFVIGGGIKTVYDLTLWRWFRTVPLPDGES